MPNYKGRRPGTRRIVIWHQGKQLEWVVPGTKAEGAAFEAKKRVELQANQHTSRVPLTFEKLCSEKYVPFAEGRLAKTTWRARKNIVVHLVRFFGRKKLTEIRVGDLDAYRTFRRAESVKGIGADSMNTEIRTLLIILEWAKARDYAVVIPRVDYEKGVEGRVRIWTPAEVQRLLEVARVHDPRLVPVIIFLVNTGCRKGEAIAAEWSWMDFVAEMIRIPATEFWSPKSGRAREVPMAPVVKAILAGERRSDRWCFPNRDNGRFEFFPDARLKVLQTKAALTGGPHTLRHTFASVFLQKPGTDLFLLAQVLGHSTEQITKVYAHLLPEHLERARGAVNIAPPTMVATLDTGPRKSKKRA